MIKFTQYIMPDGDEREITIVRPHAVNKMAAELVEVGCSFDIEQLTTGEIYMTVEYGDLDEPLVNQICKNNEEIHAAVDGIVQTAHIKLFPERYHT